MKTNRRRLLKALTLGSGAAATTRLPSTWITPVVDSVLLPAHAQTTGDDTPPEVSTTVMSGATTPINAGVDRTSPAQFRNFVQDSKPADQWLDIFAPRAYAGDDAPLTPFDRLDIEAHIEPDTAQGPGWWLVQILFRYYETETGSLEFPHPNAPPTPLDGLIGTAVAGTPVPLECITEYLWETSLELNQSNSSGYFSDMASGVALSDSCGNLNIGGPIDIQLKDADDPLNPTTAVLSTTGLGTNDVPLTPGGVPLSVDCSGSRCEL